MDNRIVVYHWQKNSWPKMASRYEAMENLLEELTMFNGERKVSHYKKYLFKDYVTINFECLLDLI